MAKWIEKAKAQYEYWTEGVWSDMRPKFYVNMVKTINITVKSFLSRDVQTQACAMTYRTLLAIVPALALIFAIGRGFGFQNLLQDELYHIFPGQVEAVSHALAFVDSYLNQASEGLFVGVGLVFLIYTVVSLVINVEDAFNLIWDVRQGRSIWRKITDYTAMLLILPVLMICAGGLSAALNTTLQRFFHFSIMTPIIEAMFEVGSFLFSCLFFAVMFTMIPNTRVKFKNACIAGLLTGTGFTVLQWIFVTGQLYVARYNAIYGSFSFLPLLLIWLQFTWVIILCGSLICYASQNIFKFAFSEKISKISRDYLEKVTIAISCAIIKKFIEKKAPITDHDLTVTYAIPSTLVAHVISRLCEAGLMSKVVIDGEKEIFGYQPAVPPEDITINYLRNKLNTLGYRDFIPNFNAYFPGVIKTVDEINAVITSSTKDIRLMDIRLKNMNAKHFESKGESTLLPVK